MQLNKVFLGDALEILKNLPSDSINCCITSPPYYGLRDYGVDGQIGLEETPEKYIERLADIFDEVKRVLRSDGTLWINIGDSYAGSGKGAANYPENASKYKQGTNREMVGAGATTKVKTKDIKPKDLIGIPWMLAFELRRRGWYLRQDIIWAKPNPMPESVTDRCTKSHEYIFLLSKSQRYYYDQEAIAEPVATSTVARMGQDISNQHGCELAVCGGMNRRRLLLRGTAEKSIRRILINSTAQKVDTPMITDRNAISGMFGMCQQSRIKVLILQPFRKI